MVSLQIINDAKAKHTVDVVCHSRTEKNPPHILAHLVFANAQNPPQKPKELKSPHAQNITIKLYSNN
ncbi:hypothetical protein SAMN04488028_1094 [Reichenbachiella agariperforans]|uniref:Uncharacterized protein n=1 Tax=Reichenbachiella agariperforans TaxID=156994 RepID=A0A1M6VD44_REIAG|nr:hypothetical protein SAMN04488028_1094 [Reichenbachiella agariperforans]